MTPMPYDHPSFPPKAGSVHPGEYDWVSQFSQLNPADGFVLLDTGKVYGLAKAYAELRADSLKLGLVFHD